MPYMFTNSSMRNVLLAAVLASAVTAIAAAQAPVLDSGVFSTYDVLNVRVRAPFRDLFAQSKRDQDYTVDATLTYAGPNGQETTLRGVQMTLRGNSSRRDTECTFPKLKLKLAKSPELAASIFRGTDELKLGTHCGESYEDQLNPRYGRLANERAVMREAFIYQLLEVLGVPSLKARPARVTYEEPVAGATPLV